MRQVAAVLLLLAVGAVVAHAQGSNDEVYTRKHKGYQ
jgi:hypothetical protein